MRQHPAALPRTAPRRRLLALTALTAMAFSASVQAALSADAAQRSSLHHQARFGKVVTGSTDTPVISAGTTSTTPSLVVNGGFEASTAGWYVTPSTEVTLRRVSGGQSGSYSGLVTNASTRTMATMVLNDAVNTVSATTQGTTYQTSAWVRATKSGGQSVALRVMEFKDGVQLKQSQAYLWLTDTTWKKVTLTHTVAATGSNLDLNLLSWDVAPGRSFAVDAVSMTATPAPAPEPAPEPAPVALSTGGGGGVAGEGDGCAVRVLPGGHGGCAADGVAGRSFVRRGAPLLRLQRSGEVPDGGGQRAVGGWAHGAPGLGDADLQRQLRRCSAAAPVDVVLEGVLVNCPGSRRHERSSASASSGPVDGSTRATPM